MYLFSVLSPSVIFMSLPQVVAVPDVRIFGKLCDKAPLSSPNNVWCIIHFGLTKIMSSS